MKPLTLSQQMDKVYLLAVKNGLDEAAEFIKAFIIKYDVINNKEQKRMKKVKRANL